MIEKHLPNFASQNTKRALVNDFGILKKLDANPEQKEKYMQQFPELELMRYWIYPKEFAKNQQLTQAIEEIRNLPEPPGKLLDSLKSTTLRFVSGWQNKLIIFLILALLVISYLQKKTIPPEIWITGFVLILFFFSTGYMYKTVPPRVSNALLIASLFYCLAFTEVYIFKNIVRRLLRYTSLTVAAFLVFLGFLVNIESAKKSDRTLSYLMANQIETPVFLTYQDIHGEFYLEDLWPEHMNKLKRGNFFTIGWCLSLPAYLTTLKVHFGGDDIMRILADGKMIFIDNTYNRELAEKVLIFEEIRAGKKLRILPFTKDQQHFLKLETKN